MASDVPANTMFLSGSDFISIVVKIRQHCYLKFLTPARYGSFFFSTKPSHTEALFPWRATFAEKSEIATDQRQRVGKRNYAPEFPKFPGQ